MAILQVQSAGSQAATANQVQNTGSNVTTNNLLIVFMGVASGEVVQIAPTVTVGGVTQNMIFIDSQPAPLPTSSNMTGAWCCVASTTGAGVITWVNSAVNCNKGYAEFSGLATDGILDVHGAQAQTTTASWSSITTQTTREASELVWAYLGVTGLSTTTLTKAASYTQCFTPIVATVGSFLAEFLVVSVTGAQTATATAGTARTCASIIATFGTTPLDPFPSGYTQGNQPNSNACYRM